MFNVSKIKNQLLSLVVLQSVAVAGFAVSPSFANHSKKVETAETQQLSEGAKLALVEGTVSVRRETAVGTEETPVTRAPMTLKQVEQYSSGLGSFGAAGL